jgi:hypothetical protein
MSGRGRAGEAAALLGTLALLAAPLASGIKLLGLLGWWALTMPARRRAEWVLFAITNAVFTVLDVLSVRRGLFRFTHSDWLGLPLYELVLWGFYLVHTTRMLGSTPVLRPSARAWVLVVAFAPCFGALTEPRAVLCASGGVLGVGLAVFHTRRDLIYVAYLTVVGAVVEQVGVRSGAWCYPAAGVPIWSLTMWGGVGLILHRVILPLAEALANGPAAKTPNTLAAPSVRKA